MFRISYPTRIRPAVQNTKFVPMSSAATRLEVCWKYYVEGKPMLIWSPGEVVRVADGTSDMASEQKQEDVARGHGVAQVARGR